MSIRTITYNFNGASVSPDTAQYGGVRYEDKATTVEFILEKDFKSRIEQEFSDASLCYRIDFNGEISGYNPSENLVENEGKVCRAIPLCMTLSGEQITAVLVVTALNKDNTVTGVVSSVPVKIFFNNVSRDEASEIEIAENITAIEQKTEELCALAKKFSNSAVENAAISTAAADAAMDAREQTENARFALESGSEFVFLGGDSTDGIDIELVVDNEISEVSKNPVQNKAVAAAINAAKNELKAYTDSEIATFDFIKIVDSLGDSGLPNRLYLVPKNDAEGNDLFDEYIWVNEKWEFITTKQIEIDLTPYVRHDEVADFIVEEGTSGVWTYRKWNSGIAECWGYHSETVNCTEARNSIYADSIKKIALPEKLFVSAPMANLNAVNATGWNFLIAHIYGVDTGNVSYIPASTGQMTVAVTAQFAISAKGRWK